MQRPPRLFVRKASCLAYHVVGDGIAHRSIGRLLNGAKLLLVFLDVVVERHQQAFCMDGIHKDTAADGGTLDTRKKLRKIEHHLGWTMRNDYEITINTTCNISADVKIQILLIGIVFVHLFEV